MFWENCQFQLHSPANFLSSAVFEKINFSSKTTTFFEDPKFWTFWEILLFRSHSTSNWLTSTVVKKFKFFFKKKRLLFWIAQCFNVLKNLLFRRHSTSNFLPSAFFEIFKVFFRKTHLFLQKPKFWMFLDTLVT